jgi:hypothetical protein
MVYMRPGGVAPTKVPPRPPALTARACAAAVNNRAVQLGFVCARFGPSIFDHRIFYRCYGGPAIGLSRGAGANAALQSRAQAASAFYPKCDPNDPMADESAFTLCMFRSEVTMAVH